MITRTNQLGSVFVLTLEDGTLVEQGTPVYAMHVGPCTYMEYTDVHRVVDKDGRIRAVYDIEINAKWVEL